MATFKAAVRLKNGTRQIYLVDSVGSWDEARSALLAEVKDVHSVLVLLPAHEAEQHSLDTSPPLVA